MGTGKRSKARGPRPYAYPLTGPRFARGAPYSAVSGHPRARPPDRPDRQRPDRQRPGRRPSTGPTGAPLPGASYPPPRRSGGPAIRRSDTRERHWEAFHAVRRPGGYPTLPRPPESPWRPSQCCSRPSGGPRSAPIYAAPAAGALAGRATVETALRTMQFQRWLYGNPPPADRRTGGVSRAPRHQSGPRSSPVYTIRRYPIYRRCISALKLHFTYLPAGRPS